VSTKECWGRICWLWKLKKTYEILFIAMLCNSKSFFTSMLAPFFARQMSSRCSVSVHACYKISGVTLLIAASKLSFKRFFPNFLSIHNALNRSPYKSLMGPGHGYGETRGSVNLSQPLSSFKASARLCWNETEHHPAEMWCLNSQFHPVVENKMLQTYLDGYH
jgi:hypothetical protein